MPLTWFQGGHRILYTMHDEDLLQTVLDDLRGKFVSMIRHYAKMVNMRSKKKQVTMDAFLKKRALS